MAKKGRQFEEAVYAFVKALDPAATVLFDHHMPDRDTGKMRQVDVWIEARYAGHFPLTILVSCKDKKRRLDVGHIEQFCGERDSVGAGMGVIYSQSGFSESALEKARACGIQCCRLYQNQPAELPAKIILTYYCAKPRIQLLLFAADGSSMPGFRTWGEILDLPLPDGKRVVDHVARGFHEGEKRASDLRAPDRVFPDAWSAVLMLGKLGGPPIGIVVLGTWRRYRSRVEAVTWNGSYCYANGSFKGSETSPSIDTHGTHPGSGWQELDDDESNPASSMSGLVLLSKPDVHQTLKAALYDRVPARAAAQTVRQVMAQVASHAQSEKLGDSLDIAADTTMS